MRIYRYLGYAGDNDLHAVKMFLASRTYQFAKGKRNKSTKYWCKTQNARFCRRNTKGMTVTPSLFRSLTECYSKSILSVVRTHWITSLLIVQLPNVYAMTLFAFIPHSGGAWLRFNSCLLNVPITRHSGTARYKDYLFMKSFSKSRTKKASRFDVMF